MGPAFFKVLSQDTEEDHHTKFKSTDISAEIRTWNLQNMKVS
jgi:hypothetical protein